MTTLRRCDERFRLRYLERLEQPTTRPARPVGSAFHRGIELRDPLAASEMLREAAGVQWVENDTLEYWCAVVEAMVGGALALWREWPDVVERAFEVPLVNPATGAASKRHRLGGRSDGEWTTLPPSMAQTHRVALQSLTQQSLWPAALLELKTTSRLDNDYMQRLRIASQPTTYLEAASIEAGEPVRVAIYRIALKPQLRPRKGESDFEYQQRCDARAPLSPLKPKTLKTTPKDAQIDYVDDDAVLTRGELSYVLDGDTWVESTESLQRRESAREAKRAPLTRKIPEDPEAFRQRIRDDYLARPEHYFAEVVVTRSEEQMQRWRAEVWEEHLRILNIERGGMTVRNSQSCLDFGRCDFFDLCTGLVDVDSFVVRDVPHPELESE